MNKVVKTFVADDECSILSKKKIEFYHKKFVVLFFFQRSLVLDEAKCTIYMRAHEVNASILKSRELFALLVGTLQPIRRNLNE